MNEYSKQYVRTGVETDAGRLAGCFPTVLPASRPPSRRLVVAPPPYAAASLKPPIQPHSSWGYPCEPHHHENTLCLSEAGPECQKPLDYNKYRTDLPQGGKEH
ncbi:Hypothetical protein NTJ_03487 [Nesidiocoris tenuis]|uniref:Uncharacterized protein n=1 Tax=Nesidiocoris tenuis TaxID=355587 RepID=A0ABN7AH33_9HEMI|nr:Hypothetical protein NTJ_03487 [Nesidiocoris tenuis]